VYLKGKVRERRGKERERERKREREKERERERVLLRSILGGLHNSMNTIRYDDDEDHFRVFQSGYCLPVRNLIKLLLNKIMI
jgi:hypothetical protein